MRWSETNSCFSQRPYATVTMKKSKTRPNTYQYPDFLMHHGIKGQQWGIRRFQNEDGSLTEDGKLRYNEGKPESEEWRKNEAEHLTDAELRRRNNRLQMERQYKDLMTTESEREAKQRRKDIINKVIIGTAVSLAAVAMRGHWKQAASFIGKFGKKAFARIRANINTKNTVNSMKANYLNTSSHHPLFNQVRDIGGRMQRPYGLAKGDARMFNYRPRINNAMPKTRRWPNI